jgi:hypothetical protein
MKELRQNEKDAKIAIVAANTTMEGMDLELRRSLERIWTHKNYLLIMWLLDIAKINRQLELESRINVSDRKQSNKGKQTTLSGFVN